LPSKKSAEKQARVAEKRRQRNRSVRSQVKTSITKAEKIIFSGQLEAAQEAVTAAMSALDKAAEKGILNSNNTARRKSRLMKKLNQASALAAGSTEPESAG